MPTQIDKALKTEIVGRIKNGEKVVELSEEYGINRKTVYNWLSFEADKAPSSLALGKLKRECEDLKKIIGTLTLELTRNKKKDA